jgi:hypothetical protein
MATTGRASSHREPEKNVLFFTKSAEYEHDVVRRNDGTRSIAETTLIQLGKEHGMAVTASKDGTVFDRDMERYDAFVFYTTGDLTTPGEDQQPPMSPGGKAALLRTIKAGKGFVGIHCASDTFHSAGERYQPQDKGIRMSTCGGRVHQPWRAAVSAPPRRRAGFLACKWLGMVRVL